MTNNEILLTECISRNIKEEVHTYAKWKSLGYKVIAGQKALFCTGLWKMNNAKKVKGEEIETDDSNCNGKMYLCKAYLFGKHQVAKMEDEVEA